VDRSQELSLARARLDRLESRLGSGARPAAGGAWAGVVVDGGSMPAEVPRVFLVRPTRPTWAEAAGSPGAWAGPDPDAAHPVLVLGPGIPREGDRVVAWPVGGGRWAARAAASPDDPGQPIAGCCGFNTAETLTLTRIADGATFSLTWQAIENLGVDNDNNCYTLTSGPFFACDLDCSSNGDDFPGPPDRYVFNPYRGAVSSCSGFYQVWTRITDPKNPGGWCYGFGNGGSHRYATISCNPMLLLSRATSTAGCVNVNGTGWTVTRP
jgi:hypothetical protein